MMRYDKSWLPEHKHNIKTKLVKKEDKRDYIAYLLGFALLVSIIMYLIR